MEIKTIVFRDEEDSIEVVKSMIGIGIKYSVCVFEDKFGNFYLSQRKIMVE
ncbi:MAG: hypothetical protein Fur0024_2240 [Patescibacteria group bacterium]